jgi:hypothetical protein
LSLFHTFPVPSISSLDHQKEDPKVKKKQQTTCQRSMLHVYVILPPVVTGIRLLIPTKTANLYVDI